jgi:DUF1016 N-terminal domain/YhcG PDDEXK nuclease domain
MTDISKEPRREQKELAIANTEGDLFKRVASILEEARANAVRAINSQMVLAYWLIGREIVQEIQSGEQRAEYGKQVLETLSKRLTKSYGNGFSVTNLKYFRSFYLAYSDRLITKSHPAGDELKNLQKGRPEAGELPQGFSLQLSWSHYRALMRVENPEARQFYEQETIECGWDKRTLERHIHSHYYERLLKCYLLIDLKMGELSHQDVGQMDGYVRMFDDLFTAGDDNPTIGLILCTKKNDTVAKYSVLKDRKQIFASKYMLYLPSIEELTVELARERRLIEAQLSELERENDEE